VDLRTDWGLCKKRNEENEEADAVRLPDDIARKILTGASLGFGCDPNGTVQEWTPSTNGNYPPVGYLRWSVLEVGNGDTYGYYWPVGKEGQDPIVCTTEHDAFRLVPLASTLAECLRLVRATQPEITDEIKEVARAFGISLTGARSRTAAAPTQALATLDPRSPQLLLATARESLRTGDLSQGERSAVQALDLLPEYGEAAFVLSQLCRRQQRFSQAAQALLASISSPLCFSGGYDLRLKCLRALQGMKDDLVTGGEVLWRERRRLTFQTGVKQNDDFRLYDEAIEAYLAAGAGTRAVWLRMLVGELMEMEAISFQERYGWTPTKHREDLRHDLLRAGLSARVPALGAAST
jgi:hypothetical protein